MITNKIISALVTITAFPIMLLQPITTFVLGLLVTITFGLLLIPFSVIRNVFFLWPLLGLSFIYERIKVLQPVVAVLGIILATLGDMYVALLPTMGELESRFLKMIVCQAFPFSYSYYLFLTNKRSLESNKIQDQVLKEISKSKPLGEYIELIKERNNNISFE